MRAPLSELVQLLAVQGVCDIEVGKPLLNIGAKIGLAPAMTAFAVLVLGEIKWFEAINWLRSPPLFPIGKLPLRFP